MSSFETSILINRPVEEVFAFITDLDTWSEWQSDLVEVKKTSPGRGAAAGWGSGGPRLVGTLGARHIVSRIH